MAGFNGFQDEPQWNGRPVARVLPHPVARVRPGAEFPAAPIKEDNEHTFQLHEPCSLELQVMSISASHEEVLGKARFFFSPRAVRSVWVRHIYRDPMESRCLMRWCLRVFGDEPWGNACEAPHFQASLAVHEDAERVWQRHRLPLQGGSRSVRSELELEMLLEHQADTQPEAKPKEEPSWIGEGEMGEFQRRTLEIAICTFLNGVAARAVFRAVWKASMTTVVASSSLSSSSLRKHVALGAGSQEILQSEQPSMCRWNWAMLLPPDSRGV